ncbi:MAG: adenylate/guanylate cyclase domain-containing protein [Opitutaceae bacterium]|nr:adenylate/guanylate cyclase domain-containing protein [Opitutaceae bacterium]
MSDAPQTPDHLPSSPTGSRGTGSSPDGAHSRAIRSAEFEVLSKLRHSLRTPLNQIIGYCEMLLESAEEIQSAGLRRDLKKIHTAGGQLLALLNDALAPWKLETGKIDLLALRHDMRSPINSIIGYCELCREEAEAAQQRLLVDDLGKIALAAQNLHSLVESKEYPTRINLGDASTDIGLSADAVLGPGMITTAPFAAPVDLLTGEPAGTTGRILVVDDDAMNREMLQRRLRRMGYEVDEAPDGRAALATLKKKAFDLVLLDIVMPELDGFHTLEFIRADPYLRNVPVIMLTALDEVDSTVRCIEAGAEDYVPKPFNPVILRARINASLEKKHLRDQEQAYLAQLHSERAKSERLLLNTLPQPIANRLKQGERTIVDSFPESTVVFADIVDFTRIATRNAPSRTVQLLNDIFSTFDRIAETLHLEKIKTIGDSYMLVGGVPTPQANHAEACADAALEMLEALKSFNRRNHLDWSIRIGMNSGPVVAGIIGTKKFSYDLWGDTVNIASRMESQGQAGRIQLSEATRQLLRNHFHLEARGMVQIKHAEPMPVYHLLGRKNS